MSNVHLILGGARSGKSAYAENLAQESGLQVTYIATAQIYDAEFGARIQHHKDRRPADWALEEEPHYLAQTLSRTKPMPNRRLPDTVASTMAVP